MATHSKLGSFYIGLNVIKLILGSHFHTVHYLLKAFLFWLIDHYLLSHTPSMVTRSHFTGSLALLYTTVLFAS